MRQQQFERGRGGIESEPYEQEPMEIHSQPGYAEQQRGQRMDISLEDALTGEKRLVLHDFVQSATVCEWCADQCLDEGREMAECVRLCRDVADLALLNVRFISRNSVFSPELADTFVRAAEECADECARHPNAHCEECAHTLDRAVESTIEMLESSESGGRGREQGQYW